MPDRTCTIEGCTAALRAKGLCVKHWSRQYRHGDPEAHPFRPKGSRQCEVIGCDRAYSAKGYCQAHYWLWRKYGDPEPFGYQCAHKKIRRLRGVARDNACQHCGKPAVHWAYDHADPGERFDLKYGGSYSLDPAHYLPLCASCHKTFDVRYRFPSRRTVPG
jgi:hypothetical protein